MNLQEITEESLINKFHDNTHSIFLDVNKEKKHQLNVLNNLNAKNKSNSQSEVSSNKQEKKNKNFNNENSVSFSNNSSDNNSKDENGKEKKPCKENKNINNNNSNSNNIDMNNHSPSQKENEIASVVNQSNMFHSRDDGVAYNNRSYLDKKQRQSTHSNNNEKVSINFGLPYFEQQQKLGDNTVSSTKYNLVTFLPKSLFLQFKRASNIYFLIVSILCLMDFTPKEPTSMVGTFAFVLFATMIKEFVEDYSRYQQDCVSNNRNVQRLMHNNFENTQCKNLRPGNIVKIYKEEEFSADILIFSTTNSNGYCYIDTKNLDGESNLKEKSIVSINFNPDNIRSLEGHIKCDKENEYLNKFEGTITVGANDDAANSNYINIKNLILKGSTLKNTDFALGIVIYTGKNTKISKNFKAPVQKVSKILKIMNRLLYSIFTFQIVICILFSFLSLDFKTKSDDSRDYIFLNLKDQSNIYYFFIRFLIFIVAYSNLIPISLYVALEIVKLFQGVLIFYDNEIYDILINKPSRCRSSDLVEELGQVEFIFSDKTGTLTQNIMILRKCLVGGLEFGGSLKKNSRSKIISNKKNFKSSKISDNNQQYLENNEVLVNNYIKSGGNSKNSKDSKYSKKSRKSGKSGKSGKSEKSEKAKRRIFNFDFENKIHNKDATQPPSEINNTPNIINKDKFDEDKYNKLLEEIRIEELNNNNNNNSNINKITNFKQNAYNSDKTRKSIQIGSIPNSKKKFSNINIKNNYQNNQIDELDESSPQDKNKNTNDIQRFSQNLKESNTYSNKSKNNAQNNLFKNSLSHPSNQQSNPRSEPIKKASNKINFMETIKQTFKISSNAKSSHSNKNSFYVRQNSVENESDDEGHDQKYSIYGDMDAYEMYLSNNTPDDLKKQIETYFLILSLCHSVFPETTDKGICYQGSSPDDIALVQGASQFGFSYISKNHNIFSIQNDITGKIHKFELLVEMPFDSDRKRMSVIVKDLESNEIKIFTKGADSVMDSLIDWSLLDEEEDFFSVDDFYSSINRICQEGLRCLVLAQCVLDEKDVNEWLSHFLLAKSKGKDLSPYYSGIECNLSYVGITGIEDKLQEGVGNTLNSLINCNIRVWVLTGDKEDTAVEIGKSCKLIQEKMNVLKITSASVGDENNLTDYIIQLVKDLNLDQEKFLGSNFINKILNEGNDAKAKILPPPHLNIDHIREHIKNLFGSDTCLVIDGSSLEGVFLSYSLSTAFFAIACGCISVICCRLSPKQKARIVKLVKVHGDFVTLSIGDGSNDVPMLMEANIGVGIIGKEGTQAVKCSDFNIGRFRFLEKLLLVYGRNSYVKISKFICFYFYKNILVSFTECFYAIYNGFSGQIFFAEYLSAMFNAFFTSWPCLLIFAFEREHTLTIARNFPILYQAGHINYYFNLKELWLNIFSSIVHSIFCFFFPFYALNFSTTNESTGNYGLWNISTISFTLVIQICSFKLLIMSNFWNWITFVSIVVAIVVYYISIFVLSSKNMIFLQPELLGIAEKVFSVNFNFLVVSLGTILCLLPDYMLKQWFYYTKPNPSEYLMIHMDEVEKHIMFGGTASISLKNMNNNSCLSKNSKGKRVRLSIEAKDLEPVAKDLSVSNAQNQNISADKLKSNKSSNKSSSLKNPKLDILSNNSKEYDNSQTKNKLSPNKDLKLHPNSKVLYSPYEIKLNHTNEKNDQINSYLNVNINNSEYNQLQGSNKTSNNKKDVLNNLNYKLHQDKNPSENSSSHHYNKNSNEPSLKIRIINADENNYISDAMKESRNNDLYRNDLVEEAKENKHTDTELKNSNSNFSNVNQSSDYSDRNEINLKNYNNTANNEPSSFNRNNHNLNDDKFFQRDNSHNSKSLDKSMRKENMKPSIKNQLLISPQNNNIIVPNISSCSESESRIDQIHNNKNYTLKNLTEYSEKLENNNNGSDSLFKNKEEISKYNKASIDEEKKDNQASKMIKLQSSIMEIESKSNNYSFKRINSKHNSNNNVSPNNKKNNTNKIYSMLNN